MNNTAGQLDIATDLSELQTFEETVPGAVERKEEVLKKLGNAFSTSQDRFNKAQYLDQSYLVPLLTAVEDKAAAIDAYTYNRHKNLTQRKMNVNGKPVVYLDPSIKSTPPREIMREALRSDQAYRGKFF